MSFIDCLVITLFNTVICIALPKVASLILDSKTNPTTPLEPALVPQTQAKSSIN